MNTDYEDALDIGDDDPVPWEQEDSTEIEQQPSFNNPEEIDSIREGVQNLELLYESVTSGDHRQLPAPYRMCIHGDAVLGNYLKKGALLSPGWVSDEKYFIPMYFLPYVPGHRTFRMAVHETSTTRNSICVCVSSKWRSNSEGCLSGRSLTSYLENLKVSMDENPYNPSCFSIHCERVDVNLVQNSTCPITVGNEQSVERMSNCNINTSSGGSNYKVPNDCPKTRFRSPAGFGATMVANSVVMKFPNIAQYMVPYEMRVPLESDTGFLCCCSSSTSASLKGIIRYAVADVHCRVWVSEDSHMLGTRDTIEDLITCIDVYYSSIEDDGIEEEELEDSSWIILADLEFLVPNQLVAEIINLQLMLSRSTPNCFSIHPGPKGYTISFSTGTMIRRLDTRSVDSITGYKPLNVYHTVCPSLQFIPFLHSISPARASLTNVYLEQAVCEPYSSYIPSIQFKPLYSQYIHLVPNRVINGTNLDKVPGLNLRVVFCNTSLTYEDGMILSRSAAMRFKYQATHTITLSLGEGSSIRLNDKIQPCSKYWWQYPYPGTVSSLEVTRLGMVSVRVTRTGYPVDGDKFTTLHGQKGIVTIVSDEDMPIVKGRYAEIVIGSTSIVKRSTPSQLIEAAICHYIVESLERTMPVTTESALRSLMEELGTTTEKDTIERLLSECKCTLVVNGNSIVRNEYTMSSNIPVKRDVFCNYGVIRVMQSVFMASSRLSYTSRPSGRSRLLPRSGNNTGGSNTLGEMEFTQLEGSGLSNCVQELLDRSDSCVVQVCTGCNKPRMLCICEGIHKTYGMVIRYSSLKQMVGNMVISDVNTHLYPSG